MCESVRNKSCCNVVSDPRECAPTVADSNFTSFTIIGSKLVLLHGKKRKVILNTNFAADSTITEISKNSCLHSFTMCLGANGRGREKLKYIMGVLIHFCL